MSSTGNNFDVLIEFLIIREFFSVVDVTDVMVEDVVDVVVIVVVMFVVVVVVVVVVVADAFVEENVVALVVVESDSPSSEREEGVSFSNRKNNTIPLETMYIDIDQVNPLALNLSLLNLPPLATISMPSEGIEISVEEVIDPSNGSLDRVFSKQRRIICSCGRILAGTTYENML